MKYTDPDGRVSINIGGQAQTGAGVAGAVEAGIKIAFSRKGFSFGFYLTESMGAEFGVNAFAGVVVGLNFSEQEITTGISNSLVIGGSAEAIGGVGLDVALDLESKNVDVSASKGVKGASLKVGVGGSATVAEGHVLIQSTQQISGKDVYTKCIKPVVDPVLEKAGRKINEINNQIKNYFLSKIYEALSYVN